MNSNKVNDWLQTIASLGVILSLIFVGLEIQQSREIAVADIYQQRAAMAIDIQLATVPMDDVQTAYRKYVAREQLADWDKLMIAAVQMSWFSYWENNYFQRQNGLLSEEDWRASKNALAGRMREPIVQNWWRENRATYRNSFANEVDQILEDIQEQE